MKHVVLSIGALLFACGGSGVAPADDASRSPDSGGSGASDTGPRADTGIASIADDEPYTLTGSGFGENDFADQLWLGGRSGSIETHELGYDISLEPRWASGSRDSGVTQVTDVDAWSHGHALAADSATAPRGDPDTGPWQGIFDASYDTGSHISRLLLHYVVRWDDQSPSLGMDPLANMQWKMFRLCHEHSVTDDAVPNVLFANWIGQTTWGRHGGDEDVLWLDQDAMPRPNGVWYTVEAAIVVNAPLAESNGTFDLRVRRMSDGVVTADVSEGGIQYIAPDDPNGFYEWIVFQNYQGNLMDESGVVEDIVNPSRIMMDDVYALSGGSGAYVVLADAPRWADVTHEEVQPIESWSDSEIRIPHLNLGAFESSDGLYLYVKTSPRAVTRDEGYPLR